MLESKLGWTKAFLELLESRYRRAGAGSDGRDRAAVGGPLAGDCDQCGTE